MSIEPMTHEEAMAAAATNNGFLVFLDNFVLGNPMPDPEQDTPEPKQSRRITAEDDKDENTAKKAAKALFQKDE